MSLQVLINGVDYTRDISAGSFRIDKFLNRKSNKCGFDIAKHSGRPTVPEIGQEVVCLDGATRIFGGVITSVQLNAQTVGLVTHAIECSGYARLLSRRLVPDSYQDMTANEIIADLVTRYAPAGFTTNNVDAPVMINYVGFNYKTLDRVFEELADLVNYNFYVDDNKDIYFKSQTAETAPFEVTDSNGTYQRDSLIIRKDNSQVRNSIVVRGGEYLANTLTAEIEANGVDAIFPLPYKFTDFRTTLTGESLNVGVDYIDNPNNFDALHNFNEKLLRFRPERKPSQGAIMRVSGRPNLPVIVKYRSPQAIATMSAAEGGDGVYEHLIIDKSIDSREGAKQRAQQEILAYSNTLSEGEFITTTTGLQPGQRIRIDSDSRDIDDQFVINRMSISVLAGNSLEYAISLITTKTYDLVDLLAKLILAETKKIEIGRDEVIDVIEAFDDTMSINETFTAQSLDYPVQPILATFTGDDGYLNTPRGTNRVFVVGGSFLGVL